MNTPEASFLTWQHQFNTEQDCLTHLKALKWPNGFVCPRCAHDKGTELQCRQLTECEHCHKQTSITAGTLFHSSNLPLLKWFWALYFIGSDKGSISALRLSKLIEVNWKTARLILTKVRAAMGHRDSLYRLSGTIELDDAFVGGKHKGKRGRGAEGKTPVIIACENRQKKAGFIAMKAVNGVNFKTVEDFVKHHLLSGQQVRTDAFSGLNIIDKTQQHQPKVTPSDKVDEWLPWVHIAIGNLKAFLLGTFHGVTGKYLQEYLDEFCYRFNRRFVEKQIPNRLLNLAIVHMPFKST
jgi:transposase-like protein|tara:strand:+ start:1562 stop:2446 length:885 start_codon:yes stop_codon:yes gene_type:complete